MDKPRKVMPDIEILPSHYPIPGVGLLPINAFVIKASEPVLIDTGMGIESEGFMEVLESVVNPRELKWVWLTHDDVDHTGSLKRVLEAAPDARLAANSLAVPRMRTSWQVPIDRVYWLSPGDSIEVGDRRLTAIRPPLYDNPTTVGVYDSKSDALFCAECFGAPNLFPVQSIDDIPEENLAHGTAIWASGDSPWVHMIEPGRFAHELDRIRHINPKIILSSHLPPAQGRIELLLDLIAAVPGSTPFVAPNQEALKQILAQMRV